MNMVAIYGVFVTVKKQRFTKYKLHKSQIKLLSRKLPRLIQKISNFIQD